MGKINKTASAKHATTLSPFISDFIKACTNAPLHTLPAHIKEFPRQWPFPRGDLYHWIPLLNRFDHILERFNSEYGLDQGPQLSDFSCALLRKGDTASNDEQIPDDVLNRAGFPNDGDRELLEIILDFTKVLLDNCGNRSLYASTGNLSRLLNTTELSLLEATLKVGLCLAQRYSAARIRAGSSHLPAISQHLLAQHYMFNLPEVETLARPATFDFCRDIQQNESHTTGTDISLSTLDLSSLVKDDGLDTSPRNLTEVRFTLHNDRGNASNLAIPDTLVGASTAMPVRGTSNPDSNQISENQHVNLNESATAIELPSEAFKVFTDNAYHSRGTVVKLDYKTVQQTSVGNLFRRLHHNVPTEDSYELLHAIRIAHGLLGPVGARRQAVAVHLLAVANLAHIYPEQTLDQKVFRQDLERPRHSQLPYQICDLIHPPGDSSSTIPKSLQVSALAALESLTFHKNKAVDVTASLSAHANHGVLTYIMRKTVAETATELHNRSSDEMILEDTRWRKTLFALLHSLLKSSGRTGEGLISAGLLDILVESLTIRTSRAEQSHSDVLNFLDVLVYNTRDAFTSLVSAKGLDAISDLLVWEIEAALSAVKSMNGFPPQYKTQVTDYQIPFAQQQTLRALFKFVQHMMSMNGGPFDRLIRNLIESAQLLGGIRTAITHPTIYGSNVWSGAVNIFSNFIHNEPTSYAAIAEAGLTKAFLETITQQLLPTVSSTSGVIDGTLESTSDFTEPLVAEVLTEGQPGEAPNSKMWAEELARGVLPSAEAIAAIPQAFGAICLNESGKQQYEASNALHTFFKVFVSPMHVKALVNAPRADIEQLGSAFDELARHHPTLKINITRAVSRMVAVIALMCYTRAARHYHGAKLWINDERGQIVVDGGLRSLEGPANSFYGASESSRSVTLLSDIPLRPSKNEDVEMGNVHIENNSVSASSGITMQDELAMDHGPFVPSVPDYIDVFAKFLLGFLNNLALCTPFAETDGIERLLDIATSPSLPYDFIQHQAFFSLIRVFQVLVENKPHLTLPSLIRRAHQALDQLAVFVGHSMNSSFFSSYVSLPEPVQNGGSHLKLLAGGGTDTVKALLVAQTLCIMLNKSFSPSSHRSSSNTLAAVNLADLYATIVEKLGKLQVRCVWDLVLLQEQLGQRMNTVKRPDVTKSGISDRGRLVASSESHFPNEQPLNGGNVDHLTGTSINLAHPLSEQVLVNLFKNTEIAEKKNFVVIHRLLSQCPPTIANFYASLGRYIMHRRAPGDSYQRQNSLLVADRIGQALVDLVAFEVPTNTELSSADSYRIMSVNLISSAVIDCRSDTMDRPGPHLLTVIIRSFKDKGGVLNLGVVAHKLLERGRALQEFRSDSEQAASRCDSAFEGSEKALKLFSELTNDKMIIEAPQTSALSARADRDRTKSDFFSPQEFLVELRVQVMQSVLPIWQSDHFDQVRPEAVTALMNVLQTILEGQQEHGVLKRSDKQPSRTKPVHKVWKSRWSDTNLVRLIEKNLDMDLAKEALYRCNDSMSMAQEYCDSFVRNPQLPRNPPPKQDLPQLEPGPNSLEPPLNERTQSGVDSEHNNSLTTSSADGIPAVTSTLDEIHATVFQSAEALPPGSMTDGGHQPDQLIQEESFTSINTQPVVPKKSPQGVQAGEMVDKSLTHVTIDDLDDLRSSVREDLLDRCLDALYAHEGLSFEVADLITAAVTKASDPAAFRADVTETIAQSLISYQGGENVLKKPQKIAACAHVLGILLQEREFFEAARDNLKDSFSSLLTFITVPNTQGVYVNSTWIASVLLIMEKILADDAQPQQIRWTPPTSDGLETDQPLAHLPESIVSQEQKLALFNQIMDFLPRIGKDAELGLAAVRILVYLTRNRQLATRLTAKRNMQRFFVMVKQLATVASDLLHSACMLVLRHVVEDDDTVRQIMRSGIRTLFESPPRSMDTTMYTKQLYHLVLRAPDLFIEVTNELLHMPRFDRSHSPQALALKKEEDDATDNGLPRSTSLTMKISDDNAANNDKLMQDTVEEIDTTQSSITDTKAPIVESSDGLVYFLLCELLAYKDVEDKTPVSAPVDHSISTTNQDVDMMSDGIVSVRSVPIHDRDKMKQTEKQELKSDNHPIHIYRCFILRCLTELLSSYNRTKIEFINFSPKPDSQAATPSKPRSGVLNYLLNVLIPKGTLQHLEDAESKKRSGLSNWAINVLVALCSQTSEKRSFKTREVLEREEEPELLVVRKFVLEHALKAFKEAHASSEPLDTKYSRMLCIADLFSQMLKGRPGPDGSYRRVHDHRDESLVPTEKQLAKIMFEKNFIAALTNSIADIDLNFPGSSRTVKYILRPLKLLTHTAVELSQSSDISISPGQTIDEEISSVSDAADDREETPDLFRNSTLGMFEPGRGEQSSSDVSDEEEDDPYGADAYADDMEYDDEPPIDDVVSDDDEDMEGVGSVEGVPGDIGADMEIDIDVEAEGSSDEDEDDSEDSDQDDEDEDAEIEVMEEITGDDEQESLAEDADEAQWEDDEPSFSEEYVPSDDVDIHPQRYRSEDRRNVNHHLETTESENEIETFNTTSGNVLNRNDVEVEMEMHIEADDPGDDESDGADDDEEEELDEEDVIYHEVPGYRSHRPTGPSASVDDGTNPLLHRGNHTANTAITLPFGRREDLALPPFTIGGPWGRNLSAMGDSPLQYFSNLMNVVGHGGGGPPIIHHHRHSGGAFHFSISPPTGSVGLREMSELFLDMRDSTNSLERGESRAKPSQSTSSAYATTVERWQQEARLLFGPGYTEKCLKVINSILKLLVPPAIQAEKVRKQKQEEQAKKEEEERARDKKEREALEMKEREEREEAKKAEEEAEAARMATHAQEEGRVEIAAEPTTNPHSASGSILMEGIELAQDGASSDPAAIISTAPESSNRTFTNIRGRQLDITDLGIDAVYLEGIPEHLREEVIMWQYAEQRSQAAAAGEEPTAINREFLDALPEDIRDELIQQEAQERQRREREEAHTRVIPTNGEPPVPLAEEMDPASFIASLDPMLRQSVLAESDEDMLAHLPAEIVAEARALGGHHRRRAIHSTRLADIAENGRSGNSLRRREVDISLGMAMEGKPQRRPIVQMLDKAGVATLLRLMYVPVSGTARQSLHGILRNACGNHQTRGEVVSGLLMILQDGSADFRAIERSFAQLTLRAKQISPPKFSQLPKKPSPGQSVNSKDASPLMVIGQCLFALILLTHAIPKIPEFFLKEHDSVGAFKSKTKSSRKSKMKETKTGRYPLNALLSLLDRKLVIDSSSATEQLAGLLQLVTQPLATLHKKDKEELGTHQPAGASPEQAARDTAADGAETISIQNNSDLTGGEGTSLDNANETAIASTAITAGETATALEAQTTDTTAYSKDTLPTECKRALTPPDIPEENLRLVVNILTSPDCTGKAFRDTLSTINNLSAIPKAKEVFGDELVKRARELGYSINCGLQQLVKTLSSVRTEMEAQSLALASFSPTGSSQTKLNRILTALDYLFDRKGIDTAGATEKGKEPEDGDFLCGLYDDPSFIELWRHLSECLSATQQAENYFFNVATILLPLVEALMVVCKRVTAKESRTSMLNHKDANGTPSPESNMKAIFLTFTNRHRRILNDLVRHNPKLMSGSFSVLVKNSGVMEFDNKRNFFNRRLHHRAPEMRQIPHPSLSLPLNVRREQVFLDSYKSLYYKSADEIKFGKLSVRFHNEEGIDAGGVTREWFQVLARQMFNPDYALFNPVASDRTTFHPNPLSSINQEHLSFFKFIGRVIGKALYENRVLDCHFSRALYKRILGKSVSLKDMESLDMDYAKGMQWILENDVTDIITETFSIAQDHFGVDEVVDLIPNGRNVPVTEENKHDYVRRVIDYKLTGSVQEQLESFLKGFNDIVPADLISIFDEGELELLISGMPEVDVDDWKNNTEYHNYSASSAQVQWFWRAVRSFDKEERAKLLQFVTGTGKVPLNGFKELEGMNGYTRFSIHKDFGNRDRLPSSHTCFNQLDLPEYESYESLRKNLYTAMTTGGEYFGFA